MIDKWLQASRSTPPISRALCRRWRKTRSSPGRRPTVRSSPWASRKPPGPLPRVLPDEETMTEEEALHSSSRASIAASARSAAVREHLSGDCIYLDQRGSEFEAEVDAVIVATGYTCSRRPQAAVRLRQVQERDHRHADGPSARPTAVQRGPAAGGRQGADSIAYIFARLARRYRGQSLCSGSVACTPSSRIS